MLGKSFYKVLGRNMILCQKVVYKRKKINSKTNICVSLHSEFKMINLFVQARRGVFGLSIFVDFVFIFSLPPFIDQ